MSDASLRCIYWSRYRDGFKTFAEQAEVPGGPLAGCVFASPAETTAWYKHPKMLPKRVSIPFDDIVALHWTTSSDPPITQLQLQVCACPALYRENPATVAVFNAPKTRSFLPHDDVAGGQANVCSVHTVAVSGGAGAKALRVALESKLFPAEPRLLELSQRGGALTAADSVAFPPRPAEVGDSAASASSSSSSSSTGSKRVKHA